MLPNLRTLTIDAGAITKSSTSNDLFGHRELNLNVGQMRYGSQTPALQTEDFVAFAIAPPSIDPTLAAEEEEMRRRLERRAFDVALACDDARNQPA